jgi:predicted nuclease of predicted toxin-antitoxin system
VRLLFDENLSPALVIRLADVFPGSCHVHDLGLGGADDRVIWLYAREHGLAIVTKDRDYLLQCAAFGHPPRVVLMRIGNCPVDLMERVLRENAARLKCFNMDAENSYIMLGA